MSTRLFKTLLRLFPDEFRGDYGREMEQVFEAQRQSAPLGRFSRLAFFLRIAGGVLFGAPREHWDVLGQDVRYAGRTLRRNPGFAAAVILTLALGIGSTTAVYSVVQAVLIRPLPYAESARLISLVAEGPVSGPEVSYLDMLDWRQAGAFDAIAAFRDSSFTLTGSGEPVELLAAKTTANFFGLLRVQPVLGRSFFPEEDQPEQGYVTLMSHGLWQTRFGGGEVVGKTLTLDGRPYTVVGVLPADFDFPFGLENAELWGTIAFDGGNLEERGAHYLNAIGRLKDGIALPTAQEQMDLVNKRLEQEYPAQNAGRSAHLVPLQEQLVGGARPVLLALLGSVGFVLLIACSNVANLLLGRVTKRHREIALRTALGARRSRTLRQLLTESLVFSALGGLLGLLLATVSVAALHRLAPEIPRLSEVGIDFGVLAFTISLATIAGMLFTVTPFILTSSIDLNRALRVVSSGTTMQSRRIRSALVVSEIALALLLLVGSALLIKSFTHLLGVDKGFDTDRVLTMRVALAGSAYPESGQRQDFFARAVDTISALPGVESVGIVNMLPLTHNNFRIGLEIEGLPEPEPGTRPRGEYRSVSPGYFQSLGVNLLKGRLIEGRDRSEAPQVVVINETMAAAYWPGENPVGRRMRIRNFGERQREIVGVVADIRHFGLDEEAQPELYVPFEQAQMVSAYSFTIKTTSDPVSLINPAREAILSVDSDQPAYRVSTMSEIVSRSVSRQRFTMFLFSMFALISLALCLVGIYGVVAHSVTQRTAEIGIRMALGAGRTTVVRMIVGQGLALTLAGLGIGLIGAAGLTGYLESLLFEVTPTDLPTLLTTSSVLVVVAIAATLIPALRAARVDPTVSLRYE